MGQCYMAFEPAKRTWSLVTATVCKMEHLRPYFGVAETVQTPLHSHLLMAAQRNRFRSCRRRIEEDRLGKPVVA